MTGGNKIKVIQIIADASLGGGPRHVLGLVKNLDREKFDVYVICPAGYLSAEAKLIPKTEVINISMSSKFDLFSVFHIGRAISRIRAQKNPFGPLIVHTHGPRAGLLGRMATPSIAKTIYTEHRLDEDYHLKNPVNEWVQKRILKSQNFDTDLIIAVSSAVKKYLINSKMAPKGRVRIVPNGIDIKATSNKRQATSRGAKAPIIGTIGNLNIQKGQTYLIEAMEKIVKSYPLATLEIIGGGEEEDVLRAEIKRRKLEKHVSLLGQRHDAEKYLRHWSVFALPSIAETFGIVILEAMQAGVPVVAAKVGGIPDIITNKKNGILVEKRNVDELANSILEVLGHSVLAAKLSREGKLRVKDYDWKKIIIEIENIYIEQFL